MKLIIDVSHWNGDIDYHKVKQNGVIGVIIKVGGSDGAINYYKDKKFETNYKKAKEAGLLVGAYWFAGKQIDSMARGIRDAMFFEELIKGKQFELPVFIDYEKGNKKNKIGNTEAIIGFCNYMEGKRYFVGVYGSDRNTFEEMVHKDRLTSYYWWVANYSTKPFNKCGLWQYTSRGIIDGIKGNIDISQLFTDVSKVIVDKGFNGFSQLN